MGTKVIATHRKAKPTKPVSGVGMRLALHQDLRVWLLNSMPSIRFRNGLTGQPLQIIVCRWGVALDGRASGT